MAGRKRGDVTEEDDQILVRAKRCCVEVVLGTVRQREAELWKRAREVLAEGDEEDPSCKRHRFSKESEGTAAAPAQPAPSFENRDARVRDMAKGAGAMLRAVERDLAAWVPETLKQVLHAALLEDRRVHQLRYDQETQAMRAAFLRMGDGSGHHWLFREPPTWTA